MTIDTIYEQIYDETFDSTYRFLKAGLGKDRDHNIFTLNQTLSTLWTYYSNDQTGRGDVAQMKIQAEIAATELVLFELKEAKAAALREVS